MVKMHIQVNLDENQLEQKVLGELDRRLKSRGSSERLITNVAQILSEHTPVHSGTTLGAWRIRKSTNRNPVTYTKFSRPRSEGTNFLTIGVENQRGEAEIALKRAFRFPNKFMVDGSTLIVSNFNETEDGGDVVDLLNAGLLPDLPSMHKRGRNMVPRIQNDLIIHFNSLLRDIAREAKSLNIHL